jgi:hypothetical protein
MGLPPFVFSPPVECARVGAVPLRRKVDCPECGVPLVRKPGGRCPSCGASVARHVQMMQAREERIERVVAVIGTALVLLVFTLTAGLGLVEGVLAYAGAGAVMFFLAKKTFG